MIKTEKLTKLFATEEVQTKAFSYFRILLF